MIFLKIVINYIIILSIIIMFFVQLLYWYFKLQPIENYSEWRLLYFISFILLVGFFVLNMFVGVVVENFHRCREEQEKEERVRRMAKRAKQMEKKRRSQFDYILPINNQNNPKVALAVCILPLLYCVCFNRVQCAQHGCHVRCSLTIPKLFTVT